MADGETRGTITDDSAATALAYLGEMSPDLRGCAILAGDGAVLAASGDAERWREDAAALLEIADRAGAEAVEQVHIATEQGEVFALSDYTGYAVTIVAVGLAAAVNLLPSP